MNYLMNFWLWAGITSDDYSKSGLQMSDQKAEFFYPEFDLMVAYAKSLLQNSLLSNRDLDDLLMIMALDNEEETVLDYVVQQASNKQIDQIIRFGVTYKQPETRWQVSEILFRRRPLRYIEYLKKLSIDSNTYVRQRANNCLKYLDDDIS